MASVVNLKATRLVKTDSAYKEQLEAATAPKKYPAKKGSVLKRIETAGTSNKTLAWRGATELPSLWLVQEQRLAAKLARRSQHRRALESFKLRKNSTTRQGQGHMMS